MLTARPFRKYLVQENLSFYWSFRGSKAWPLNSHCGFKKMMVLQ
jgi:hypothetical protein